MGLTLLEQRDLNRIWAEVIIESGFREDTFSTPLGTELGRVSSPATQSAEGLMSSSDKQKLDTSYSVPQNLTGGGTLSLTNRTSFLISNGIGNALILTSGLYAGQRKSVTGTNGYIGGNTSVITPSTFADGTTITFSSRFDSIELEWTGSAWKVVSITGTALIA